MFSLESGCDVVYTDHRRFGIMDLLKTSELNRHKLLAHLGPEPLIEEFTGKVLYDAFQTKKSPVKTALLDQRIVAGLGNIYVCEALNTVGISPRRKACNISKGKCTFLVEAIKNILLSSIAVGGSTLQDFAGVDGDLGYFPASFRVYGREGEECQSQDCDGNIKRISQAGRSTFFCSSCQY
jgi:formamidopyrimidine-DNA glycosylase